MSFNIAGIIVDIIIVLIFLGGAVYGYKKGLSNILFNFISLILSLVLMFVLYKPVTNLIIQKTDIEQKIEEILVDKFSETNETEETNEEIENEETENTENTEKKNIQLASIFKYDVSELVSEGEENSSAMLAKELAGKIVKIIVAIVLFFIVRLILVIIKYNINVIFKLPIINVIDGTLGMAYGLLVALLIIYIIFVILSLIAPVLNNSVVYDAIDNSRIGNIMFNKNILLNLITK